MHHFLGNEQLNFLRIAAGCVLLGLLAFGWAGCGDKDLSAYNNNPVAVCGNERHETGEECDGAELGGESCASLGLGDGILTCQTTCTFDTSGCDQTASCGNASREYPEQCDGADLNGQQCINLGFDGGTLGCTDQCTFDTGQCDYAGLEACGKTWGPAIPLENAGGNAIEPSVAVDPDGNAVAVWSQYVDSYRIFASRYTSGVGWDTPVTLDASPNTTNTNADVALDDQGNALVVWIAGGGSVRKTGATRYAEGVGWDTPVILEGSHVTAADSYGFAKYPKVAVSGAGDGMAVWVGSHYMTTRQDIWYSLYAPGSGWQVAERFESIDENNAQYPVVALDAAGNGVVLWYQNGEIWAGRYEAGIGPGPATLVSSSQQAGIIPYPTVAMVSTGEAVGLWGMTDGVAAAYLDPLSGWESAVALSGGGETMVFPGVALDSALNATLIWGQVKQDPNEFTINTTSFVTNGFGTVEAIAPPSPYSRHSPKVATSPDGTVVAVWLAHNGTTDLGGDNWNELFTACRLPGGAWSTPVRLHSPDDGSVFEFDLAVDPQGNAVVVWRDHPCHDVTSCGVRNIYAIHLR